MRPGRAPRLCPPSESEVDGCPRTPLKRHAPTSRAKGCRRSTSRGRGGHRSPRLQPGDRLHRVAPPPPAHPGPGPQIASRRLLGLQQPIPSTRLAGRIGHRPLLVAGGLAYPFGVLAASRWMRMSLNFVSTPRETDCGIARRSDGFAAIWQFATGVSELPKPVSNFEFSVSRAPLCVTRRPKSDPRICAGGTRPQKPVCHRRSGGRTGAIPLCFRGETPPKHPQVTPIRRSLTRPDPICQIPFHNPE